MRPLPAAGFLTLVLLVSAARIATAGPIATIAGGGSGGDGIPAREAILDEPRGLAMDAAGNFFFSERARHRVRRVDAATGVITTVAGTGIAGFQGDGGHATLAQLNAPASLALDPAGFLYIGDAGNARIRRVALATGIITTYAGNGVAGSSPDGTPVAQASLAGATVAIDVDGDPLIVEYTGGRVRKVSRATGALVTLAGTGMAQPSFTEPTPAMQAALGYPSHGSVCANGDILIATSYGVSAKLLRLSRQTGLVSVVAGLTGGDGGEGVPASGASLGIPGGLLCEPNGDVLFADAATHRVRRIVAATGLVHTVAGSGTSGFSGDEGPAREARLWGPSGVAVDPRRGIVFADAVNDRVRRVAHVPVRGDVSGEGKAALFWREVPPSGGVSWWTMAGALPTASSHFVVPAEWKIAATGDFDGDGKADLLWQRPADGALYLWLLDGLGIASSHDLGSVDGRVWTMAGAADIDGDFRSDLLWRGIDGTLFAWRMSGPAIVEARPIGMAGPEWVVVALADFDGNGKADVLWRRVTDGATATWHLDGAAVVGGTGLGAADPATWSIAAATDFDGDGHADLLWRSAAGDVLAWRLRAGAYQSAGYLGNPGASWAVSAVADFDGDGRADIVWRHADGTVYHWKMNGLAAASMSAVPNPGGGWQVIGP
jgi:hypothetical protein